MHQNLIQKQLVITYVIDPVKVDLKNLHDFRYDAGAPINSGFQIPLVNEKREYGPSYQARTI